MSDTNEAVVSAANFVFQLLSANYGSDKLIRVLLSCLNLKNSLQIKLCALNGLLMIIKDENTLSYKSNIEYYVKKIAEAISDNYNIKAVVLPALNILLALRDKDYDATISMIISLPENQLDRIQNLTKECANDLQGNLSSFRTVQEEAIPGPINESKNGQKTATKPGSVHKVNKTTVKEKTVKETIHSVSGLNILRSLLNSYKELSADDTNKLLNAINETAQSLQQESFWSSFLPQILDFLFNTAISNESFQKSGLNVLKTLISKQADVLLPCIEMLVESIAHCFTLPRKNWELIFDLCNTLTMTFTPQVLIPILSKNIIRKEHPNEFIRCMSAIVRSSKKKDIPIEQVVNILHKVMHPNA